MTALMNPNTPQAGITAVNTNTLRDLEDWELDAVGGGLAPIAAAGAGAVMGAAPEFFNAAVEGRAVNWGAALNGAATGAAGGFFAAGVAIRGAGLIGQGIAGATGGSIAGKSSTLLYSVYFKKH